MSDELPPPPPPSYDAPPAPVAAPTPAPRKDRRLLTVLLSVLGAVAALGAAVLLPLVLSNEGAVADATLDEVQVFDQLRTDHTDDEVDYELLPPPGGPHADAWHACGVYDRRLRDENVVHSLEHGTIWITHDPELSSDEVDELAEQLPPKGILSPHPEQDARVVITVWGRRLEVDEADDPRLELFVREYADGATAPEPGASCAGGIVAYEDGPVTSALGSSAPSVPGAPGA